MCKDVQMKEDLLELLTGHNVENGECILNDIDSVERIKEYKKMVDLIDLNRVESSLSVKNYLIFYTMVVGIYHDKTAEELVTLFSEIDMEDFLEKSVNDLNNEDRIRIRCIAAYLRKVKCLIGKDLLAQLEAWQIDNVLSFLKKIIVDKSGTCILLEDLARCGDDIDAVWILDCESGASVATI